MEFVTFNTLSDDMVNNMSKVPQDYDIIVGVPRSGLLVANMLALYMNKPLTDLDSFCNKQILGSGVSKQKKGWVSSFDEIKKALIVEDSINSGYSIEQAKRQIEACEFAMEIHYLAAYIIEGKETAVDYYFRKIEYPRLFEWNYLHQSSIMSRACFDMDGVLCEDPTNDENDDGEKYRHFILNAKPKLIPTVKIGWIITSRLEKYRQETECWLKENGVEYNELIMMQLESAEERRKLGNHADYKAQHYRKIIDATIFIESDDEQAKRINMLSEKQVFCVQSRKFYVESKSHEKTVKRKRKIKLFLRAILPDALYKRVRLVFKQIRG